ncbi:MAG: UDP-N-acetylmuramate dehydrogenase [Actinobacteria bacterium]|nr:UDP-N-acetylmuramate dehydrogenase [Actinomycetota bacterium]
MITTPAPTTSAGHERWLAPLTTLGLGGTGSRVFELTDSTQLPELAALLGGEGMGGPPVPIGGGSNILVADEGVTAPVLLVRTRGVTHQRAADGGDRVLVTAQAGHPWPELVEELATEGLVGMETMAGIPGTVGAMPVQNVGAYGQETADTLVGVRAWDWQRHREVRLDAADCRLGHRSSRFKHTHRWLILEVMFAFTRGVLSAPVAYRQVAEVLGVPVGTRVPVGEVMAAVRKVRAGKGMLLGEAGPDSRTVGSVFLSPRIDATRARVLRAGGAPVHDFPDGSTRVSASWLMREAGLTLGEHLTPGVRVSTRHYTLVAEEGATTASFVRATRITQERVQATTGVILHPEPDALGPLPAYRQLLDRTQPRSAGRAAPEQ